MLGARGWILLVVLCALAVPALLSLQGGLSWQRQLKALLSAQRLAVWYQIPSVNSWNDRVFMIVVTVELAAGTRPSALCRKASTLMQALSSDTVLTGRHAYEICVSVAATSFFKSNAAGCRNGTPSKTLRDRVDMGLKLLNEVRLLLLQVHTSWTT